MDQTVHHRTVPGFGAVSIEPIDPLRDLHLIVQWVKDERALHSPLHFLSWREILELHELIEHADGAAAYLIRRDRQPVAMAHVLPPDLSVDPWTADAVEVSFFVAADEAAEVLLDELLAFLFLDPDVQRVTAAPHVGDRRSIDLYEHSGFVAEAIRGSVRPLQLTRAAFAERLSAPC